jgi:hypothetical protein
MLQAVLQAVVPGIGDIVIYHKDGQLAATDVVFHFASQKQPLDTQSMACLKRGGTWLTLHAVPASDTGPSAVPVSLFPVQHKPVCFWLSKFTKSWWFSYLLWVCRAVSW